MKCQDVCYVFKLSGAKTVHFFLYSLTLNTNVVAGLLLIGKHAAQFKEYLAKDHEVC